MSGAGPKRPAPAYDGDEPYVFVSYAHADARQVFPEIARLVRLGYRVWYDEGLHPGSRWSDELAERIQRCSLFVIFVTSRSIESAHCQDEISLALDLDRPLVAVHLVECELPAGLRLRMGPRQAVLRYKLGSADVDRKLAHALGKAMGDADAPRAERSGPAREEFSEGEEIGVYRLLDRLGEGGMGTVFLAEQREPVQRKVALKVIKLGMDTKEVLARFEAERQALALMAHPNVAAVYDAGATPSGRPFFAMEYVPGQPITEFCDRRRLSIEARIRLLQKACAGVLHAHQKGIVHRDLKPGNILVAEGSDGPVVKIIDFGVAKSTQQRLTDLTLHTRLGDFVGSPLYASPEQASGDGVDVDTRADVYSLGAVLYELLVGSPPIEPGQLDTASQAEVQRAIRETDPPLPATRLGRAETIDAIAASRSLDAARCRKLARGDVASIVMRAIEKDRERRYGSAASFSADLDRFLAGLPVEARAQTTLYRSRRFIGRHALGVGVTAIVALLLVGATVVSTHSYLAAEEARDAAAREAATATRVARFLDELFRSADPGDRSPSEVSIREVLDLGAERIATELKDDPLVRATLMTTIAGAYGNLALYDEAERLAAEAVAIRSQRLGLTDPETLDAMGVHATALERAGRLSEAAALGRRMSELAADPSVATADAAQALGTAGRILSSMGQFEESAEMLERALAAREATLAAEDPDLLAPLSNLAVAQAQLGRNDLAIDHLTRALDIAAATYGEEHVRVAQLGHNLAILLRRADRLDEASAAFERALAVKIKVLGEMHPSVNKTLNGLGSVALQRADLDAAIGYYERALANSEASVGSEHPGTANSLANLAEAQLEAGAPQRAEALIRRAVDIRRQLTPDHPYLGTDLIKLGDAQQALGAIDDAASTYREALKQLAASAGEDHADTREAAAKLSALGGLDPDAGGSMSADETDWR